MEATTGLDTVESQKFPKTMGGNGSLDHTQCPLVVRLVINVFLLSHERSACTFRHVYLDNTSQTSSKPFCMIHKTQVASVSYPDLMYGTRYNLRKGRSFPRPGQPLAYHDSRFKYIRTQVSNSKAQHSHAT